MPTDKTDARVVLLTGGTSGIGRVAATTLAERGATVAVVARDSTRGESLADESDDSILRDPVPPR